LKGMLKISIQKNTMSKIITNSYSHAKIILDRLTVCFNDKTYDAIENVNKTCGLLISETYTKEIPGIKISTNGRYKVQARIPFPHMYESAEKPQPIFLEAGPKQPKLPSYRLDFNPAKMSEQGISELLAFLDSIMDADMVEFFGTGRITRADVALDMFGLTLEDVIVRAKSKQKHGVYSDRYGVPEMAYLGTPRSAHRVACYTKTFHETGDTVLRLEVRLRPQCQGKDLVNIKNPFKHVQVIPLSVLDQVQFDFPSYVLADSIRLRGIKRAIADFDPLKGKAILQAFMGAEGLLPDTDTLWGAWPHALIMSGLGKELGVLEKAVSPADYAGVQSAA
jgi:hypothetical protein